MNPFSSSQPFARHSGDALRRRARVSPGGGGVRAVAALFLLAIILVLLTGCADMGGVTISGCYEKACVSFTKHGKNPQSVQPAPMPFPGSIPPQPTITPHAPPR